MANTKTTNTNKRASSSKAVTKKTTKTSSPVDSEPSLLNDIIPAKQDVILGKAVQIYVKSSSHAISLTDPKMVILGGISFIEGTQVTGKVGHRLEGKRTLVATDNIASLIEFASEDDIWSEPQSKLLRHTRNEEDTSPVLTLHEQGQPLNQRHSGFNNDRPRFDYPQRNNQHRDRDHKHRGSNRPHDRNRGNRDA